MSSTRRGRSSRPGLYEHEKKLALPLVVGSTVLFLAGVAFCYFFVFGQGVRVHPQLRAESRSRPRPTSRRISAS